MISRKISFLHLLPGLIILAVGGIALQTSVKLSSEHSVLAHYASLASEQGVAEKGKVEHLIERAHLRENQLYWSVILISLTAFVLLILNADKFRQLESMNISKQEALKLLQDRLSAIEASFEGIFLVDHHENLTYMNPAMAELCGIPEDKKQNYIGAPWLNLYGAEEREHISSKIMPEFQEKWFWRGRSKITRQNGDIAQLELSMTLVEDGGFIGAARDITGQERADAEKQDIQDQLFQAQKMEAVGRLAGGIAHDFNNILAAMNGYAEFLAEDLDDDSQLEGFALNILQAGRQARQLVDQILTFSRRKDSEIEKVDLCAPLEESLSMLRASLSKSIEIETDIRLGHAHIDGNATQISQIIMNLSVNACDAMGEGRGKLYISLSQADLLDDLPLVLLKDEIPDPGVEPQLWIEDGPIPEQSFLYLGSVSKNTNYAKLSIKDTGTGMGRIIMEKIFEPFFTTKDLHKGTGLGLSSVHGIITAHRGALVIESILEQGTSFDLFFPMSAETDTEDMVQDKELDEYVGGGNILLVEDQPEVQEMTKTMLKRLGYSVDVASDGLDALDLLRESPDKFSLVLTDQNMPKMTGLELIEQAHHDFPEMPFILLSGYSEEKLQGLMQEHPAVKSVMRKPVSQKALSQKLSSILMRRSSPQPQRAVA